MITDLTGLSWGLSRKSSGTAGSFLKAYEEENGKKYYYKMSNFDTVRGVFGHECINEMVAQNIADMLGIEHLRYDLLHAEVVIDGEKISTWLTRSENFRLPGEHKMTFETFYELNHVEGETPLQFALKYGDYFHKMFLLDYLICNRDRHGANVEVLVSRESVRFAPLFDNGLSFVFSCYGDGKAMKEFDMLKTGPVNNFIGSMDLAKNLEYVPVELLRKVREVHTSPDALFKGLEQAGNAVPEEYWEVVAEMIERRCRYVAEICG